MRRDAVAWLGLAAVLGTCALAGWWIPHTYIDWQPALAWREPWRAFSAVGVHYGAAHLCLNLGGLVLTGLLGWAARTPCPIAVAWLVAWPLTQAGLLMQPAIAHYGGLSGVLHAGVAAAAVGFVVRGTPGERVLASLLLAGLATKVLAEVPWGAPLRPSSRLGIVVAPLAHATGALAGVACAVVMTALCPGPQRRIERTPRA